MNFSLAFCLIFIVIQVGNVYSKEYTVNHEVENSIGSTIKMYRKLFDEEQNFVFSPLSFRIVYSILYQSSKDKSEDVLKKLMFDKTEVSNKSDLVYAQSLNIAGFARSPSIKLANKIYLANNVQIKSQFNCLMAHYYAAIEQVDFKNGGSVKNANLMNSWVEEQTNDLIKNLVEPSSITPTVKLFLINTVYFKDDWLVPFDKLSVRPKLFKSIDGACKLVDCIHGTGTYKMYFNDKLKVDVLELPYTVESGFVFWIILPRHKSSLGQLKDNLSVDFFNETKNSLNNTYAKIQFPIFKIESNVDGEDITPEIFGENHFDLIEDNSLLAVDEIKQKAKIIVDTKGTEAAAATYAHIQPLSLSMTSSQPKAFKANRPFIYAVVLDTTKEPVFIGHFSKP